MVAPEPSEASVKAVAGLTFPLYGSHSNDPNVPMLVMACGIGMDQHELDTFLKRLRDIYKGMPVKEELK